MIYSDMDVFGIIAAASNIRGGQNPDYTKDDFLGMYPQFGAKDADGNPVIPDVVLEAWIKLANASLSARRYRDHWKVVMGLFIAHWLTLYLQSASGENSSAADIVNAGLAKGVQTSKSAGDLSVSYDFSQVASDFNGWGTYKLTVYGQQFVTIARLVSLGGMTVW